MTNDPASLLRALGSGIRPAGLDASRSQAASGLVEGASFQQMLREASDGQVSSDRPIRVSRHAGVDLTPSQLNRLAAAADRAEAAGATKALVMIDGMVLQMDVGLRTITGKADTNATKVLSGVDAVLTVAPEAGELQNQPPTLTANTMNASLLRILGGRTPPRA
jgi:hypothetical protein